jgi:tRNA dimethylallyltransferase
MGPTASGKTEIALRLADQFLVDIVSVDSALIYRGMDIGTAKPSPETLAAYPHALVDIRDPEESYSAGDFVRDAQQSIDASHAAGRLPLLVGGTMMYFRSLIHGIAELPEADSAIRAAIDAEAGTAGWPALHRQLAEIDPKAAGRISPNDSQRIQRALEVFRVSGRTLTAWHESGRPTRDDYDFIRCALLPEPRKALHRRIEQRLDHMLDAGFIDEVRALMAREDLTPGHPSMRAVGYRQYWAHLAGETDLAQARQRALAATRQLAKRQFTWLRSEAGLFAVNPLESDPYAAISAHLEVKIR